MVDIVTVTCDGYTFPKNGRLVDQDNRTPLHLACMSEDIVFSTKVCAVCTVCVLLNSWKLLITWNFINLFALVKNLN